MSVGPGAVGGPPRHLRRRSRAPGRRRWRGPARMSRAGWRIDLAVLLGATVLLVLTALAAGTGIPGPERAVFRAINGLALPYTAMWLVMQVGNFVAVPVAAVVAAAFRRWWLALCILAGGALAYELALGVKHVVRRIRPGGLLPDIHLRHSPSGGLGFVSGHAAVAAFLATMAWPYLGRAARWAVAAVAVLVCFARVYIGAHLPLDVLGGAALGVAVGAGMVLLLGRPERGRPERG